VGLTFFLVNIGIHAPVVSCRHMRHWWRNVWMRPWIQQLTTLRFA